MYLTYLLVVDQKLLNKITTNYNTATEKLASHNLDTVEERYFIES